MRVVLRGENGPGNDIVGRAMVDLPTDSSSTFFVDIPTPRRGATGSTSLRATVSGDSTVHQALGDMFIREEDGRTHVTRSPAHGEPGVSVSPEPAHIVMAILVPEGQDVTGTFGGLNVLVAGNFGELEVITSGEIKDAAVAAKGKTLNSSSGLVREITQQEAAEFAAAVQEAAPTGQPPQAQQPRAGAPRRQPPSSGPLRPGSHLPPDGPSSGGDSRRR